MNNPVNTLSAWPFYTEDKSLAIIQENLGRTVYRNDFNGITLGYFYLTHPRAQEIYSLLLKSVSNDDLHMHAPCINSRVEFFSKLEKLIVAYDYFHTSEEF